MDGPESRHSSRSCLRLDPLASRRDHGSRSGPSNPDPRAPPAFYHPTNQTRAPPFGSPASQYLPLTQPRAGGGPGRGTDSSSHSSYVVSGRNTPGDPPPLSASAIEACRRWCQTDPRNCSVKVAIQSLNNLYGGPLAAYHDWFAVHAQEEDPGYQTGSQPGSENLDNEITQYLSNRWKCNRVKRNQPHKNPGKYFCTSKCGASFKIKGTWDTHEKINRPHEIWICSEADCRGKGSKKHVEFRKDKMEIHLTNRHGITAGVLGKYHQSIPLYDMICRFFGCCETFFDWKQRNKHVAEHFEKGWTIDKWVEKGPYLEAPDTCLEQDGSRNSDDDDDQDGSEFGAGGRSDKSHGSGTDRFDRRNGPRSDGSAGSSQHVPGYEGSHTASLSQSPPEPMLCRQPDIIVPKSELGSTRRTNPNAQARKPALWLQRSQRKMMHPEAYVLGKLSHPHIVHLVTAFQEVNVMTIFMEPAADCNLLQYMGTAPPAPDAAPRTWDWVNCLVSGLQYMHETGIRHRDIKPSSILIKNDRIFYADFRHSNFISDEDSTCSNPGTTTKRYEAPEIRNGTRGRAYDIWSLGCVLLEVVTFLLHQSIDDLQLSSPTGFPSAALASYSTSLDTVSAWIKNLRQVTPFQQDTPIQPVLDACQAMLLPEPEKRPRATDLAKVFAPRTCCLDLKHSHGRRLVFRAPNPCPTAAKRSHVNRLPDGTYKDHTVSWLQRLQQDPYEALKSGSVDPSAAPSRRTAVLAVLRFAHKMLKYQNTASPTPYESVDISQDGSDETLAPTIRVRPVTARQDLDLPTPAAPAAVAGQVTGRTQAAWTDGKPVWGIERGDAGPDQHGVDPTDGPDMATEAWNRGGKGHGWAGGGGWGDLRRMGISVNVSSAGEWI